MSDVMPAPPIKRVGRVLTYRPAAIAALVFPPAGALALHHSLKASRLERAGEIEDARIHGGKARDWAWISVGVGLSVYIVGFLVWLVFIARGGTVQKTYFKTDVFFGWDYWRSMLERFWLNVQVFIWAEIIVLVWALAVAVVRLLPGPACAPLRWLATVYVDLFRGLPAILVIFLIGYGLPLAQVPMLNHLSKMEYAIMALSLTYGAYVSEVYRAGIESVHWGQTAAARSLGLSYNQTMAHVVIPQAVRRIGPPLLNDFIGLQKDTSLISFIGAFDAVATARFINNNNATFSAYTIAAVLFFFVTLPFTRYLDFVLRRQKLRTQGGQ